MKLWYFHRADFAFMNLLLLLVSSYQLTNKPGHSISNKIACTSEDLAQSVHPLSDQTLHGILWVAKDPKHLQADSKDSDQPAWMCRLIGVFAGHTCHLIENAVSWPKSLFIILCTWQFAYLLCWKFYQGVYLIPEVSVIGKSLEMDN